MEMLLTEETAMTPAPIVDDIYHDDADPKFGLTFNTGIRGVISGVAIQLPSKPPYPIGT
jgi:hypothetical protein